MDEKPKAKRAKPPKKIDTAIDPEVPKSPDAAVDLGNGLGHYWSVSADDGSNDGEWFQVPDTPYAWEVRTPAQLREDLAVNEKNLNSLVHWTPDEAIKILSGIGPNKFDPRSKIHHFYLKVQNIQGLKVMLEHNFGGPLPEWLKRTEWRALLGPAYDASVSAQGSGDLATSKQKKFTDAQATAAHQKYIERRGQGKVTLQSLAEDLGTTRQALIKRWKELGLEWRLKPKKSQGSTSRALI